jgi:putative ABC transport system ATP-binding protein
MNVIELAGVSKVFKTGDTETVALRDVSLTVAAGEFVAIIGPSGSGKSTLMNILGLLDTPTDGDYFIDGDSVKKKNDRQLAIMRRHKIGFVFQTFNLLARLTVLQNIILPMVYGKIPGRQRKPRALELLERVGLSDRANFRTNQISGGQTQRAAIARALANNPSLILADEPTGNLDTKSSDAVISLMRKLNDEGTTLIIVTHNPEIAAQADRIIELRDGQIISKKSEPRNLKSEEQKEKTAKPNSRSRVSETSRKVQL